MLPTSADGSDYSILHPTQALFPLAESGEFVPQSLGLFVCVYVCVWHVGSYFPTRDQTHASCSGRAES